MSGNIRFLVVFITLPFFSNAQTLKGDSSLMRNYSNGIPNKGAISIAGGIGYSTINIRLYGLIQSGQNGTPSLATETPVYNASIEYGIDNKTCIGIGITYQYVTGSPKTAESQIDTFSNVEQITRWNIGFRYIKFLNNNVKSSLYYGARAGVSLWWDKLPSYLKGDEILGSAFQVYPSGQFFIGYRLLLLKYITFHIEAGIGTPYLFETGLGIRI